MMLRTLIRCRGLSAVLFAALGLPAALAAQARVSGVVVDSLTMRRLQNATVQLVPVGGTGAGRKATTDARGAFEFTDVPLGSYLIGFFHPKLDSLGLTSETKQIDLHVNQPFETQLSIASGRTLGKMVCGASFVSADAGLVMGFARKVHSAIPIGGATLSAKWADVVIEKGSVRRTISSVAGTANATGWFALCGVPVGVPVIVQAAAGADSSGQVELTVPNAVGYLGRDLVVAPVSRMAGSSSDSASEPTDLTGTGRMRGKVLGSNQRPLRDARVTVRGTVARTTSNADGEFSLGGLPLGTHTMEVRAIGFSPANVPVDIVSGLAENAEVELTPVAVTLDTIRVSAQRVYASRRLMEVERRSRSGMGHILNANEINKRNPWTLTDLLRTMPGIRMTPGKFMGYVVRMREPHGMGFCAPSVIVDNIRMTIDDDFPLDQLVPMEEINTVEVYTNMVPGEFFNPNNCGVIAVTTGGRPAPDKR